MTPTLETVMEDCGDKQRVRQCQVDLRKIVVSCKSAKTEVAAPSSGGRQEKGRNLILITRGAHVLGTCRGT